jgi:hypothetical protein
MEIGQQAVIGPASPVERRQYLRDQPLPQRSFAQANVRKVR